MGNGPPYRRRIFLINRRFQLRFAFYVCSFLFALSFAYPLIIDSTFDFFIKTLAADPAAPSVVYLDQTRKELLSLLVLMEGVFLSIAFIISIFISHRVAGPLFKLGRYFREARDGNIEQKLFFRKNDYFQELCSDYNAMMESIQKRVNGGGSGSQEDLSQSIHHVIPLIENASTKADPKTRADLESALTVLRKALKN